MSNFAGHATAGFVASSVYAGSLFYVKSKWNLSVDDIVIPSMLMFVFSLFPDIDIKSTPSKIFYTIILGALIYLYVNGLYQLGNLIAILAIIPQIVSHRGIFHSPFTALVLPSCVFYLKYIGEIDLKLAILVYIGSVIGYCIHITLDRV